MAITRTAKGTASAKASGTTLSLTGVSVNEGTTLIVGVAYDNAQGLPDVVLRRQGATGGGKPFDIVPGTARSNAGISFTVALFRKRVHKTATKDIVLTWSSAIGARAMFATEITEASKKDVNQDAEQDATGSPATGPAVTTTVADTIAIAAFMSNGPSSDTAGTAGVGHTLGQRVGTTGAPPVSNVTIQETYELLPTSGSNVRATLSGATSRDWANTIAAFAATQTYTVTDGFENLRIASHTNNPGSNHVLIRLESETTGDFIDVRIDVDEFDAMTDQEVTDRLTEAVAWHADHVIEATLPFPEADSGRDTRIGTFVNDTIKV